MRMMLRQSGPAFLALMALAVLAAWPVLRHGAPTVGDGQIHYYRLAELDWARQHGVLYPRWLPDLAFGFGLPVFNFYPPLSYWAAELWALLKLPLPVALQAGYLAALLVLVAGAFAWARAVFGSLVAGLAAAAGYSAAPYLYLNLVHRGAYPEIWGMALAPWLFLAVLQFAEQPGHPRLGRQVFALTLTTAALVLTHPLSAVMLLPLAVVYLASLIRTDRHRWLGAGVAFVLAAGLTALFWWPLLWEARFVQLSRLLGGSLDYRHHFLSMAALFSPPRAFDPLRTFNPVPPSVNWVVLPFALAGWWVQRRKPAALLAAAGAVLLAVLTLSVSGPLWAALPLLHFVQFPWRFVGPLSLLLALLAGGAVAELEYRWRPRRVGGAVLALFAAGTSLFAFAWSFGDPPLDLSGRDHADIPAYAERTGQLGTTATGEFLTIWASRFPDPQTLASTYARGELPPARLDRPALPASVQVLAEVPGFDHTVIDYEAQAAFDARLHWLFFPDVQAEASGELFTVAPEPETGVVRIAGLPPGRHTLTVRRVASQPQRVGTAMSLASALGVLGLGLSLRRGRQASRLAGEEPGGPALAVALAAAALLAVRGLWLDMRPSIFYHSRLEGQAVAGTEPRDVSFSGQLNLIGVRVDEEAVRLYWRPLAELKADYSVALFLEDAAGYRYGQQDNMSPGPVPTSRWQLGQYAEDVHRLVPLPGTPPGEYRLVVSVYSRDGALDVETSTGPAGQFADAGVFVVPPAERQPTLAELKPQTVAERSVGDFTLLGYDVDRPAVVAGSEFYVTLYWRAERAAPLGMVAEIAVWDAGQRLAGSTAPLTTRTTAWAAGEVARGPRRVVVPAETPAGVGAIVLHVGDFRVPLGAIEIVESE